MSKDEDNLHLAQSTASVDSINAKFYGRFQFPWPPQVFSKAQDPDFETLMLNQNTGSWDHSRVLPDARIWVAGCGTNQAVFTALQFPNASILGTDLSANSLEIAAHNARTLGISNLELKQESINRTNYVEEFDYIICTGVIHHNADPNETLKKIATALKKTGILELMVYNRYHRIVTTAFQKAIRMFAGDAAKGDFEQELIITKKMMAGIKVDNMLTTFLEINKDFPEAAMADNLLQPVEYSFTVESLQDLIDSCGLELLVPCINQYDKANDSFSWNMEFVDPSLQKQYDCLPDLLRWQISNLLMLDRSPMLWFYVGRKGNGKQRKSESLLCQEFLDLSFRKSDTTKTVYIRTDDGKYVASEKSRPHPGLHTDPLCRQIINNIESQPSKSIREIFNQLQIETAFTPVNDLRLRLTTNAFPYLVAHH